ncbi:MAG TPA: zinc ribbon domain-containing protein [Gemmatimonadales bacterium]|nr:zinc ribbon domain-containing protein [Gemmatimonadales bacterium]
MTEIERFAALLLAEMRAEGARPEAALGVGALLDRTFPYKVARRTLQLESAEDYEAMVLRLVAEEADIVVTEPMDAAEMARTTLATRIPDLDVLRLLRSASVTFTDDAITRLDGVRILPSKLPELAAPDETPESPPEPVPEPPAERERVFPIRRQAQVADATRVTSSPPPADGETCWSCGAPPPPGRRVSFCVSCGADQRAPTCGGCGTAVERSWKHCPDCGQALGGGLP